MTNKEKLCSLDSYEAMEMIFWLVLEYGSWYTNSRLAVQEWLDKEVDGDEIILADGDL